ncbi:SDR family oxidoreductase [Roseateles sp. L2-2]|uniref:SDR family oxidoreductase n=1 Tax=Roseateles sp. L2-2 TaxID=3422597 RepID=UPI003D36EBC5
MSKVLVTGGSGFLGSHCIVQLLQAGHDVRATVRSACRASVVRDMVRQGGAGPDTRLDIVVADLGADAGWAEAVAGCDHVLHTASPFPPGTPKHEDELIVPAREGTLRVLRAARAAGVRRVVLTSSFAAIGYGHTKLAHPLDESSWSRLESGSTAYVKSKTLAERAAWDFVAAEGRGLELVVINPVGIFGPVLGPDYSSSIALVKRMLDGHVSACPQLHFGVVDVRDVAELHLRAMTNPQAASQRFLASAGDCVSMLAVAQMLRAGLGETATLVPTRQLPNWLVRLAARFRPELRQLLPELGKVKHLSNRKARSVLGWQPRGDAEAVIATAESLVRMGLLGAR